MFAMIKSGITWIAIVVVVLVLWQYFGGNVGSVIANMTDMIVTIITIGVDAGTTILNKILTLV